MNLTTLAKRTCISAACFLLGALLFAAESGALYAVMTPEAKPAAPETAAMLDGYYAAFNEVFHFSKTGPGFLFPVTLCASAEEYREYVKSKTGGLEPAADAVFLRYNNPQRSEVAARADAVAKPVFIRQLFLQYLTFYLPEHPYWLFGGYTLIFENPGKTQNPWLETAKKLASSQAGRLTLTQILAAGKNDYGSDRLFPQAMLFVQFLEQNTSNTYRRMLFEGIAALKEGKNSAEAFLSYAEYWPGMEKAEDDFSIYVSSIMTVNELLAEGIAAYAQNDAEQTERTLARVLAIETKNATALYYLGLNAYRQKNYTLADERYKSALEAGTEAALVNWALAVCAYADGRYEAAVSYAQKAKQLDKNTYGTKADELIKSIPQKK